MPLILHHNYNNKPIASVLFLAILMPLKIFAMLKILVACYEDDDYTQNAAHDFLEGKISAKGKLPVTVCDAIHLAAVL